MPGNTGSVKKMNLGEMGDSVINWMKLSEDGHDWRDSVKN